MKVILSFGHFDKKLFGFAVVECGGGEIVIVCDGIAFVVDVGGILH